MGIENLLAQGVQITRPGMEQNALMQYQQFQDAKQKNALMQMQMQDLHAQRQLAIQQAQQVADDRKRLDGWRNSLEVPQDQQFMQPGRPAMNAAQAESAVGNPNYGMSSAQDQMRTMPADPRMVRAVQMAKDGQMTSQDLFKLQYPEPMKLGKDDRLLQPGAGGSYTQLVGAAPEKPKEDGFVALLRQSGIDPMSPKGQALLAARMEKESTHAPAATQNNFGGPTAGQDPKTGKPAFAVTDKRGNVKVLTDIVPPGPKPTADYLKQSEAYQNMDDALTHYQTVLGGFAAVDLANPSKRAGLSSAYQNALLQAKEIYKLGVLNGGDERILKGIINSPLDLSSMLIPKAALNKQASDLRGIISRANANLAKVNNQETNPLPSANGGKPKAGGWTVEPVED